MVLLKGGFSFFSFSPALRPLLCYNLNMPNSLETIAGKVHRGLREKGLTVSVAESCTGGLLSHYLTLLPGSSDCFKAGIVAYAISAKESILHISRRACGRYGVVSPEIAEAMAGKVRAIARTDYSIATTGNLGPDVLENKDHGLVYIAVNSADGSTILELRLSGSRQENKEMTVRKALETLLNIIDEK